MKHKALGGETCRRIKQMILAGKYTPGHGLIYELLSKEPGVSQTPLKEGFLGLEQWAL